MQCNYPTDLCWPGTPGIRWEKKISIQPLKWRWRRAAVVGIMIDMCQIAVPSLHVAFWPLMFSAVCVLQCCGARSYQFTLIGLTLSCPWGNAISGRFYCFKPDHLLEDIFMFANMCAGLCCDSNTLVCLSLQLFIL